ncbi:MAG: AraC family transcriptional regulator [Burkholderiaceae bacterium]
MVLRTPDFATRLDAEAARHRHVVVDCTCAASATPPGFERLSLRSLRRGTEVFRLGARRVVLHEDNYLVVNGSRGRASAYVGEAGVSPLVVMFRPGSLEQCLSATDAEFGEFDPAREAFNFLETLQPHGGAVTRHLSGIERALREGIYDGLALEECIELLLGDVVATERETQGRESTMAGIKPSTRRELLRRVLMATDYIQSSYDEPILLHDIAAAAHLSPYHLVRLFRRAHGLTPHAYLTRKRLSVALRLVSQTRLGLDDIAERAGLGTRSSLFRHLRRQQGSGALALRARGQAFMEPDACTTPA